MWSNAIMNEHDPLKMEKKFSFLVEREKLLINLETARKISKDVFFLTTQLNSMMEELAFTRADMRSLETKLNRTAIEFGLEPIPTRYKKL
jgi:hypothetical protein